MRGAGGGLHDIRIGAKMSHRGITLTIGIIHDEMVGKVGSGGSGGMVRRREPLFRVPGATVSTLFDGTPTRPRLTPRGAFLDIRKKRPIHDNWLFQSESKPDPFLF